LIHLIRYHSFLYNTKASTKYTLKVIYKSVTYYRAELNLVYPIRMEWDLAANSQILYHTYFQVTKPVNYSSNKNISLV